MFHILVVDEILPEGMSLLRAATDAQVDDARVSRTELEARIGTYDAVITRSQTPVDAALLALAAKLKVVARAGLSLDNIDIEAATDRGVMVMHTPEAYSLSAAEHTLALMLALCRQVPAADAAMRRGEWARERFTGAQLHGKTLGLVGLGRVGRLVAARAQAFGMAVLAYDPYTTDEAAVRRLGVTLATLDEVLAQADFVSLHAELTPETTHLIGRAELAQMKPGARLINCARGALVDEAALAEALRTGRLAGAALDVFTQEPPADDGLSTLPNVVLTPHIGASTTETQREASAQIARQVLGALRGTDYTNVVNLPFAVNADFTRARPYLELAERIGALQSQMAEGLVQQVEVEVKGAEMNGLVKAVAVALLKGLLSHRLPGTVNYVNAPVLAGQHGVTIAQARGLETADYANLISCRVRWPGGQRTIAGTLFGGAESRIVQLDQFRMDARPQGQVLIMHSRDVPGVIGIVGTLLYHYGVNIAEWRLGRDTPGGTALSFINLDSVVPPESLVALRALPQVVDVRTVWL